MPPNQGCTVFHTPKAPNRIFCPIPISIKKSGIPSNINIMTKGIRKAPEKRKKIFFQNR